MKRPYNTKNIASNFLFGLFSAKTSRLALTALTVSFATAPIAAWNNSTDTTPDYVDSVHNWGAWELDIEPAAGGLQQASSQVVNPRDSKASLRIDSVSVLAPTPITAAAATPPVPVVPSAPARPPRPAVPTVTLPAAPAAATPTTTIIVNLPPTSNVTPIVSPATPPTGTSGLF